MSLNNRWPNRVWDIQGEVDPTPNTIAQRTGLGSGLFLGEQVDNLDMLENERIMNLDGLRAINSIMPFQAVQHYVRHPTNLDVFATIDLFSGVYIGAQILNQSFVYSTTNLSSAWTQRSLPSSAVINKIAHSSSAAILVGNNPTGSIPKIFRTTNGTSFSEISVPASITSGNLQDVIYEPENDVWIIVGGGVHDTAGQVGFILRSTDNGASWNLVYLHSGLGPGGTLPITSVAFNYETDTFLACSSDFFNPGRLFRSTNSGTGWSNLGNFVTGMPARGLTYGQGKFVIGNRCILNDGADVTLCRGSAALARMTYYKYPTLNFFFGFTSSAFYFSIDGTRFINITDYFSNVTNIRQIVNADNNIYIAEADGGVFNSAGHVRALGLTLFIQNESVLPTLKYLWNKYV